MDDLVPIGRFARLTGLSVGALRHYDQLDLLRPARTDPFTSYRLYRRDQLETARTIVRLRDLEVPLETIRELLATDDPADRRRLLRGDSSQARRRPVQPHLDAAGTYGPDARAGRRDDPQRARVALPLGRGPRP